MGFDSIWHWLLLLVIVLVIFGTGKLTKIGPDLGNAVRGFKKALSGEDDDKAKSVADNEKLHADPPPAAADVNAKQEQHDSSESK
ncbi:MAG: twin-arginine translocase TatA/TatE family subunit [Rhodanobacteraceae bacterium]